jgi:hypothetical protein
MSVSRTLGALAILAAILGAWLLVMSNPAQAAIEPASDPPPGSSDPVALLESDAEGIVIAVQLDNLEFERQAVNGSAYDVVSASALQSRTPILLSDLERPEPGQPAGSMSRMSLPTPAALSTLTR